MAVSCSHPARRFQRCALTMHRACLCTASPPPSPPPLVAAPAGEGSADNSACASPVRIKRAQMFPPQPFQASVFSEPNCRGWTQLCPCQLRRSHSLPAMKWQSASSCPRRRLGRLRQQQTQQRLRLPLTLQLWLLPKHCRRRRRRLTVSRQRLRSPQSLETVRCQGLRQLQWLTVRPSVLPAWEEVSNHHHRHRRVAIW
jgi:hypothetical protein